ncbi:hypothetical protein ACP3V3_02455 [Vibrio sp. PNB22_3_1]
MKTKRHLFYTGGSDSTLLLASFIDLMNKNKEDELNVILIGNETLGSGQHDKIMRAVNLLLGCLLEKRKFDKNEVLDRIEVNIISTSLHKEPIKASTTMDDEKRSITLGCAKTNPDMRKFGRSFLAQEVILINQLPTLLQFLGSCRNKFYLGTCGGSYATSTIESLKQLFNLQFSIMTSHNEHSDLDQELIVAGLEALSARPQKCIPSEWLPSLHFPLAKLKKNDVLRALEAHKISSYAIDKTEDLITFFNEKGEFAIQNYAKILHDIQLQCDDSGSLPDLVSFIRNEEVRFKINGKEQHMTKEHIDGQMLIHNLSLLSRSF